MPPAPLLAPARTPAPTPPELYPRRWWTLAVLCLSLLIVFVGNSSLNVAIPTLSRDLHATESQLQWVVAAYSLVFAGLLFSTGALGDRFGRKGALQLGLVGFLVGAALASEASSMTQLIACRALMGASAALIMPSTLSILVNVFPAGERAKAIAIWAATTGAAGAIGPVASGWLLGHFWFGSVFLVNIPIIAVALVAGWFLVPKSKDPEHGKLDPFGAVLSIVGISALVFGLIEAPDKGWGSTETLIAFTVAVVVLAAFVVWELRVDEADARHAVLPFPRVQHRNRRDDPRLPLDVRGDVPHHPVLPARARLQPALRGTAPAAHGADHDRRRAAHPPALEAVRRAPCGRVGDAPDHGRHADVPGSGTRHAVLVRAGVAVPARRRDRADDVADDRGDHVGRAGPACRARVRR